MAPDSKRVRLHLRLIRVLTVLVDTTSCLEVEVASTRSWSRCPFCGFKCRAVHDTRRRKIRDLPVSGRRMTLVWMRRRRGRHRLPRQLLREVYTADTVFDARRRLIEFYEVCDSAEIVELTRLAKTIRRWEIPLLRWHPTDRTARRRPVDPRTVQDLAPRNTTRAVTTPRRPVDTVSPLRSMPALNGTTMTLPGRRIDLPGMRIGWQRLASSDKISRS